MAIVRNDRRPNAVESLAETREGLHEALQRIDASQAALDDLELHLGLGTEAEQGDREQYLVLHYPKGGAMGHTLDECDNKGCAASASNDVLAGLDDEVVEDQPEDKPED